jgi:hypothetical protein
LTLSALALFCLDLQAETAFFNLLAQVSHADRRKGQIAMMQGKTTVLYFVAQPD